jgi:hypothetical protein
MKCIHITSLNSDGVPSIDQYINGDGDLNYDTTYVVSSMIIPPYSINLFETYIDECATNNGGCGDAIYYSCVNNAGAAPACNDIDECATNNGGCGDATYYSCVNNAGAAPACSDIDECATNNGGCGDAICVNNEGTAPTCSELSLFNGLIPEVFSIHSIYPNPFNPVTNITYGLPEHVNVQITVYDMGGTQITILENTFQIAGYHTINWNASSYPSGVYLIRMDSSEFTQTQKVVLVK